MLNSVVKVLINYNNCKFNFISSEIKIHLRVNFLNLTT